LLHLSTAAREAKRARKLLLDLTQLGYLDIDVTREPMLEARGIENILSASRNTLRRRRAERARTAHDGSH
jgi:hypothetical protein